KLNGAEAVRHRTERAHVLGGNVTKDYEGEALDDIHIQFRTRYRHVNLPPSLPPSLPRSRRVSRCRRATTSFGIRRDDSTSDRLNGVWPAPLRDRIRPAGVTRIE